MALASTDQKPPCRSDAPPPAEGGGCIGVEPVLSGVVTVVWRVVVLVTEGSLEQETSIKPRTESAEPSMIALFIP
jgi:hypothetical protein